MNIRCAACRVTKAEDEFHRNKSRQTGRQIYCKPCMLAAGAASRTKHIERLRPIFAERQRLRRRANVERYAANDRRAWLKLRGQVIAAYGGKCACCGESDEHFMALDHKQNDGAAHRREIGGARSIYYWLRANGFPRDRFQLLCHNCNMAKSFYGQCPHQAA